MSGKNTVPPGIALVIPSYNPDDRLFSTVLGLLMAEAAHIVIVDDGSGPGYRAKFDEIAKIPGCVILRHEKNRGKGAAIKTGMAYCLDAIPDLCGVVTVDGDGHHRPCDVASCAQRVQHSGQVILGQRDKRDKTLTARGRLGNRLTAIAISVVCDFKVPDPMSGLRGIPVRYIPVFLKTKGDAYDFETNMILDLKRKNVPFRTFRIIGEFYHDGSRSHYRLVRDTAKIAAELIRFFGQQFKYLFSSVICYFLEYLLYRIFLAYLPAIGITLTNYLCRLLSGTANFLINKNIVFGVKKRDPRTILRYVLVVLLIMSLSTEIIVLVNLAFRTQQNTVAKYIKPPVDLVLFFLGYFLQKKWVFKQKKT